MGGTGRTGARDSEPRTWDGKVCEIGPCRMAICNYTGALQMPEWRGLGVMIRRSYLAYQFIHRSTEVAVPQ